MEWGSGLTVTATGSALDWNASFKATIHKGDRQKDQNIRTGGAVPWKAVHRSNRPEFLGAHLAHNAVFQQLTIYDESPRYESDFLGNAPVLP